MLRMVGKRGSRPAHRERRRAVAAAAAVLVGAAWPWRFADAAHVVRAWPRDRPVPRLDLVDLAGQVVVLNFWATWCAPCRIEMPSLDALAARRRADGVVVIAVNYREAAGAVLDFVARAGFASAVLLDSDGTATVAWTPRVFPTTVLIGRDGVPAQVVVGELDCEGAEAKALLDPLVAQRRT